MNFEAVIGLEIHVEMKTNSKMFSTAPVRFGSLPNTNVMPLDFAFPGTMPVVNKQAVINAIRVAHALHMTIDHELWFDRKNYFYSDLPKGYQITQDKRPIGRNGYLDLETSRGLRHIEIERIHMEEDTCKQLHLGDCSLLDYNRAGTPLIEIVSRPDLRTGEEARKYVEMIRSIVIFSDVSDGKMEEGSLRCDVNISLRPVGSEKFGTKVEIKNLNSTANIERAIEVEIERQTQLLLLGQAVEQETRRFDEATRETVLMRKKTDAVDYKYFTEPNITPIRLSDEFIENAIRTCPMLAEEKRKIYKEKYELGDYDIEQLLSNKDVSNYFDQVVAHTTQYKLACNWVMVDVMAYLNKEGISIQEFKVSPDNLAKLINMIQKGTISSKQSRQVFEVMVKENEDPEKIAKDLHLVQMSDTSMIRDLVLQVLAENPQSIEDFKNGKDRAVGFLVGMVMKKSQGKANPQITNQMIVEELKKR